MEQTFKHTLPLQIRFNDIDMLGHLNNSVYFNFFDLGKSYYFEAVKGCRIDWRSADIVIANLNTDFLIPVFFNEAIVVQTAVTEIGNKSLRMTQRIINPDTQQIKCVCTTIMVGFDVKTSTAKQISDEWKTAIMAYEGNLHLKREDK